MTVVLVTWAFLVTGCAAPAPPATPPPSRPAEVPTRAAAQQTLQRLAAAILDRRQADFQAEFAAADAVLRTTTDLWWANLTALRPTRFALVAGALDDAGTGEVTIDWAIPGDSGTATHRARFTFAGAAARLTALRPADPPGARPVWWSDPIEVVRQGRATAVIVGAGTTGRAWADRADRAAGRVLAAVPESLRRGWSGAVVIEVPATAEGYDRLLGGEPGRQSGYAAVAWAEGVADPRDPATERIAVRVVVNPDAAGLDPRAADLLLTHEVTHLARYDAGSAAPLWLVEGFADLVAYPSEPDLLATAEQNLRATVRQVGAPTALPADDDFRAGSDRDLDRAYLLAWSACLLISERYGAAALHHFVAAAGAGTGVDRALRSAAGVDLTRFTADWRQSLIKDAGS
ncbi:hypothetical protein [Microlunatus speluncae]|uniref:hypothetical protein n=1 Tax=Microlunatus speluncae TaxID=2594267 RepID=UPI001375C99D|nr:hypothetical protein [Microlunatus speluncae]